MQKKSKRVPTQVHTRKLDRMVARNNMEKKGIKKINEDRADESFFSNNRRSYAGVWYL